MASMFEFMTRYTKPGKGVDKDAPEKRALFRFFDIFWRKLYRLVTVNVLYVVTTLPFLLTALVGYNCILLLMQDGSTQLLEATDSIFLNASFLIIAPILSLPWPILVALAVLGLLLFGPFTCGLTYICRNFAREEHAWTSDYFSRAKKNWKNGMLLGVVDALLCAVLIYNVFVAPYYFPDSGLMMTISRYVAIVLGLNYFIMRPYLYLMTITFDLKFTTLFKNAWILSGAAIVRSMTFMVLAIVTFALFQLLPYFEILFVLIAFSFWSLLSMFIYWPVVDKYLVKEEEPEEESDEA